MKRAEDIFHMTIGAISMAKKSAQSAIDDMIKKGDLQKEEGKKVLDEINSKFNKEEDELYSKMKSKLKDAINELEIATKDDLEKLKNELLSELKKS